MVFLRPANVAYPAIWRRFTVRRDGVTTLLRIQDLTEELRGDALALMEKYFMRDEPPCKFIGIENHPRAVAELKSLWDKSVKDNLSLVCVKDNDDSSPTVVAVNVLTVVCKTDKEELFQSDDKVWCMLFGAVDLVARSVDIFEKYDVDKYMTAYGLVVDPEWRGLNIGKELLETRFL